MDTQLDVLDAFFTGVGVNHSLAKHRRGKAVQRDESFRCRYCQAYVHSMPVVSGVRNRNHCPYCLWSRHVDLLQAGDRLSACKATMQPIGLTIKHSQDKYGYRRIGELMLIHYCSGCGKISINRIAADDSTDGLLAIFHASSSLDITTLNQLDEAGICMLQPGERKLVERQLFGNVRI